MDVTNDEPNDHNLMFFRSHSTGTNGSIKQVYKAKQHKTYELE